MVGYGVVDGGVAIECVSGMRGFIRATRGGVDRIGFSFSFQRCTCLALDMGMIMVRGGIGFSRYDI